MAISKERKSNIVSSLENKIKSVKSAFFVDYTGMTVKQTQNLKKALGKVGSEYVVSKKNLLNIAFKNNGVESFDSQSAKGGCAIILNNNDEVSGIKEFYKFNKEYAKKAKKSFPVLGGFYEGKIVSTTEIDQLSSVLSREEFVSKFMYILNSSASSFARAINAVAEKKQAGEPAKATEVKEEVTAKVTETPVVEATPEVAAEVKEEVVAETTETKTEVAA